MDMPEVSFLTTSQVPVVIREEAVSVTLNGTVLRILFGQRTI